MNAVTNAEYGSGLLTVARTMGPPLAVPVR
jgi:hypothetical protein